MGNVRTTFLFGLVTSGLLLSCGGGKPKPDEPKRDPFADPKPPDQTPPTKPTLTPDPPKPTAAADRAPELIPTYIKIVGVGQKVSFGVPVIDQDLDETVVEVTKLPASAKFDAITQTITWTPTKADQPKGEFEIHISQPKKGVVDAKTFSIDVDAKAQPLPVAEEQSAVIETLLMIRQPKRLEQVNKDWPLDKMLRWTADNFKPQFTDDNKKLLNGKALVTKELFDQFLKNLAETNSNPRLDPKAKEFDKKSFGDPKSWKIVAFRPRIDKAWAELRVVYQAVNAPEPVFAMFRIRPVTEYVPALPRPEEEKVANNKVFLGLVAKHLLDNGAPSEKFLKDQGAHGKAVAAFMNEFMKYDDTKTAKYLKTFSIGIAMEARMGGGSARKDDGTYASGDGWAWSAQKPFQTQDGKTQAYVNVTIPGFWTQTVASKDGKSWEPKCGPRWTTGAPDVVDESDKLCRKTMGFVDLPDQSSGKNRPSRIDANNLFVEHKNVFAVKDLALDDGRRDMGEENGVTCAQCHIRNFGMHDYSDLANTDPSKGVPKTRNHKIATLNFQIIPGMHWEEFTLEFLKHQECRGKQMYEQYLPDAAKGLTCPLAK
ncbi:MAG: Ig domain-containing protein [Polyangiales bacterium]